MKKREEGFLLITVYWLLTILVIFAVAGVTYALADLRASQRLQANVQAFYLAEAGIDQAIVELRGNWQNYVGTPAPVQVGNSGDYNVQVEVLNGDRRRLTVQGNSTPVQRTVEVIVQNGFFDNVIWASQNLDFNGNSYSATGNVRHGDLTPSSTSHVTGTVTYDLAAHSLPPLSFQQLHDIAQAQGNIYDAARMAGGSGVFPTSFWYTPPTDPNDPSTGVPNVNYLTSDLILSGNFGTVGGFFVVAGSVLMDPTDTENTTLNGNGQIAGAVYTTGNFRINGGGNGLNVDGGVWAGNTVRLNGNTTLTYNGNYMKGIEALDVMGNNVPVRVLSWREQ